MSVAENMFVAVRVCLFEIVIWWGFFVFFGVVGGSGGVGVVEVV